MSRPAGVPEENFMLDPGEPHAEVMDLSTRQVWQSRRPMSDAEYEALAIEAPLVKIGIGRAAMDEHWFRHSPGAVEDGPMALREIDGREFAFCAMPGEGGMETLPGGARLLPVNKHHSVRYRAGRDVDYLLRPDGTRLVHVIAAPADAAPLALPPGWKRETVRLANELVIDLPCPTTVYFFPNGDSFQGPVEAP